MLALSLPFKRILFALALFVTFALYPSLGRSESPRKTTRATLPVLFEPNRGQAPSWARYIARTLEGEVSLASDRIEITQPGAAGGQNFELRFNGANPRAFHEEASKDGSANYYFGGQNMRSIEHVPLYRTVRYGQLYPGIDLVFHGRDGRLEYDFAVAPDASTEPLRIDLADAEQAETQDDGSLLITSNGHSIRLLAPQAFQRL